MAAKIETRKIGSGTVNMEVLNLAMAKNPQIMRDIYVNLFAKDAPLSTFLHNIGISDEEEMLPSNMIRWQVWGHPYQPSYIRSVSTATPTANVPFDLVVSNGWFRKGAVLRTQITGYNLRIQNDGEVVNGATKYKAVYIANSSTAAMPAGILVAGSGVEYGSSSYEEASETGHPLPFVSGPDWYTNVMTISRHKESFTGSAITEALVYEDSRISPTSGAMETTSGFLPLMYKDGRNLLREHIKLKELNYIYGVGNFDPLTGEIFTTDENGQPVPMGDGWIAQFQQGKTVTYDSKAGVAQVAAQIKAMRQWVINNMAAEEMDLYVMGGLGARTLWQDVLKYEDNATGVTTFKEVGANNTIEAGVAYTGLKDFLGTVKFIANPVFDAPTNPSKRISYNGTAYTADSMDFYFFFVKKSMQGKSNIRTYTKGKNWRGKMVDRSLVYGYIPGMSGWAGNGAAASSIEQYRDAMRIATGRDADQFEVLSEGMLILANATEFGMLKHYR